MSSMSHYNKSSDLRRGSWEPLICGQSGQKCGRLGNRRCDRHLKWEAASSDWAINLLGLH